MVLGRCAHDREGVPRREGEGDNAVGMYVPEQSSPVYMRKSV